MTDAQKRRAAELGNAEVRTIPDGSVLMWVKKPHGYWLEVVPPEPDYLLAFDFQDES